MKKGLMFACFLFSLFAVPSAWGQVRKAVNAKLNEVTVFFKGAELMHSASLTVVQGENEIWIEGLSPEIDRNSLKIKASNGIVISSFEYSVDYLSGYKGLPNLSIKKMDDSISYYRQKIVSIDTDLKVNNELIGILKKSTDKNIAGTEKGMPIDELVKTMEYYKSKLTELENTQRESEKKKADWNTSIVRLGNQVRQESVKNNKTSGVLKLTLSSPLAVNANFSISYYTPSASWVPFYDINIESTDKPIKFVSKAKVRQVTGLDWERVKLTLSSATPSNGKTAPLFSVWFLENLNRQLKGQNSVSGAFLMSQNAYSYDMPIVPETAHKKEVEVSKDELTQALPIYVVDGTPVDADYFNAVDRGMVKNEYFLSSKDAINRFGTGAADQCRQLKVHKARL